MAQSLSEESRALLNNYIPPIDQHVEPDYLFVVDRKRSVVVTSQLDNLNLDYVIFRSVHEPISKALILVYFKAD